MPRLTRIGSGLAAAAVGAGLLALGTAAAPARHVKKARPRLVATPATLVAATQIAPGDRIERLVELRVRGRGRVRGAYFEAAARKSSALDSDARDGLQVTIERCSKRWQTRGLATSCPARHTVVLRTRPFVGRAKLRLGKLSAKTPAHLRLVLVFPARAGNGLQGQETDATYRFVGIAR
jgi:hypothetical protein